MLCKDPDVPHKILFHSVALTLSLMVLSSTGSVANPAPQGGELPPRGEHAVQRGETLGILASRYGVSVAELAEANDILDVDLIVIGRVLRVPRRPEVALQESPTPPTRASRDESEPAATAVPADPHPGLTQLEALYRHARFEEALAGSQGPAIVDTRDTRVRARLELLRGKLATAFGRGDEARRHFARARSLDPSLVLPADGSPKVAALFRAADEALTP